MISLYYHQNLGAYYRQNLGLAAASPEDDALHKTIEVIDDLSVSERATFASAADMLASWATPREVAPDPSGVTPGYDLRRMRAAKRAGFGLRVLGSGLAMLAATRGGTRFRQTSVLELVGWAIIGFFRPLLGTAAAAVRGGSR